MPVVTKTKLGKVKPFLTGRPYYCDECGAGFAEYMACEESCCNLESPEKAMRRRQRALDNGVSIYEE